MIRRSIVIQLALYSLLLSIFLISLYPFYLIPVPNILFSTHTIAKILICYSFASLVFFNFRRLEDAINRNRWLFLLLLAYFLGQSLSIVNAQDVLLFLKTYQNSVVYIFIFLTAFLLIKTAKYNTRIIMLFCINISIIIVLLELVTRIFWNNISPLFSFLVQKEVVDAYFFNLSQGKQSLAFGNERFLPFLLFFFTKENSLSMVYKSIIFLILLIAIALSLLSNFRTRIIVLVFCLILYIAFLMKDRLFGILNYVKIVKIGIIAVLVLMVAFFTIQLSNSFYSYNVVDRFLLENESQDLGSVNTRINQIQNSVDLFRAYPAFGSGLGNYPIYFNSKIAKSPYQNPHAPSFIELSSSRPHSVIFQLLGETGLVGLSSFLGLILFFILVDIQIVKSGKVNKLWPYIISSWSIIIYGLFNPLDTVYTFGWFWFCRGIIQGYNSSNVRNYVALKNKIGG